jgi:hypothetical protein
MFIISIQMINAQKTTMRGLVTDAKTGEALPFVSIVVEGTQIGTSTDFNGQYFLETNVPVNTLKFSLLGYKTEYRSIDYGNSQIISVKIAPETKQLQEITVKGSKQRYRNKDNPAVELIRRVIDKKKQNRKESFNAYQYEKYEKVQFALSNITDKFKNKKYLKNFQFIFDNLDSNQMPGKVILPMYLKETLSDVYYKKDPKKSKEIIKATKQVDFQDFANNDGISNFIAYLYQDVDIYNNTVPILTNPFISPIADNGPLFYRYYIKDTVFVDKTKCYHMIFYPRNKADFGFQGELYITYDTNYAVRKNELTVTPDINLNWVKEMKLTQEYSEVKPGEWLLDKDNISIDFGIGKNGMGIYGQRAVSFKEYKIDHLMADEFYSGLSIVMPDTSVAQTDDFWDKNRHSKLTASEKGVYTMVDSIQKVPTFRHMVNILELVFAGYKTFGGWELGPVNTFYSYNPIEGLRVRVGGRSNKKYSPRIQYESYAAYGFKDERWKYFFGIRKALGKKSFLDFPQKNLIVSYQYETKIPGQELQFVQEDNVLLSIKRGDNDKMLYNRTVNVSIVNEFASHFSFNATVQYLQQEPAGKLYFNKIDYNEAPEQNIKFLTTTQFDLTLRYAPHEQFYQGKNYRTPMYNEYPIFQVQYTTSMKDVLKSDYTFNNVSASIFKRFNLAPIGYTDILLKAGKVFGHVPYPLLEIHRANQTFSYQLQSYNLMNFLEFISDEYTLMNIDHYFNGFFFNKIPLLKKLKWREIVTLKILYGRITDDNNPSLHPDLFKLPVDDNGVPLTYSLEARPYMEASVGVANILKLFRVDLIKRLTYLEHPNVAEYGIRARFKLDF